MTSLQGPPPVISCVLIIMVSHWPRETSMNRDYKTVLGESFPMSQFRFGLRNGCGPRPRRCEGWRGGSEGRMLWFVSQSCSETETSREMMDGIRGQELRRKSLDWRGGGKMCSDESREWYEKEKRAKARQWMEGQNNVEKLERFRRE